MKNDTITEIHFFKERKMVYFEFDNKVYEYNIITINKLREKIVLPYKINFSNLKKSEVENIILKFAEDTANVVFYQKENQISSLLEFEAIFNKDKKVIDVYKMSSIACLYGMFGGHNPYIYIQSSGKNILMEVTKNDIKVLASKTLKDNVRNDEMEYFFLASDLPDADKRGLDSVYTQLECDYVYTLNHKSKIDYFKKKSRVRK